MLCQPGRIGRVIGREISARVIKITRWRIKWQIIEIVGAGCLRLEQKPPLFGRDFKGFDIQDFCAGTIEDSD